MCEAQTQDLCRRIATTLSEESLQILRYARDGGLRKNFKSAVKSAEEASGSELSKQPDVLQGNIVMDVDSTPRLSPEDSVPVNISETELNQEDVDEIYKAVYKTLSRSNLQTLCMSLATYFHETLGYGKTAVCQRWWIEKVLLCHMR